jgi:molecular chaperone GrpE
MMKIRRLFEIQEQPVSLPPLPQRVELIRSIENMYVSNSKLEDQLEAEKKHARKDTENLLLEILEVVDSLDRICVRLGKATNLSQVEERLKGNIEATRRLALQKLKRSGVSPIELIGKVLDPNLAEVEDYEVNEDMEDETVLEEIVKGYIWKGNVLRQGRVIISKKA